MTTMTNKLTATQSKLIEMLKTNTGTAMMDSGGTPQYDKDGNYTGSIHGYGRAHERNQSRSFIDEDEVSLRFDVYGTTAKVSGEKKQVRRGDVGFVVNVFHFLDRYLEYDEQIDNFYNWYLEEVKVEKDDPYPQDVADFMAWMCNEGFKLGGLYGGGDDPMAINTYNEQSNLDQVLQFSLMCVESVPEKYENRLPMADFYIVMLQIHQGADMRGGYTMPTGFTMRNPGSPEGMVLSSDGYIYCNGCEAHWSTDDGYHWYEDGSSGGDKILDWPAYKEAEAVLVKAKEMHQLAEDMFVPLLGARATANWTRLADRGDLYGRLYCQCFDILDAYRTGDEVLAEVLMRLHGVRGWMITWLSESVSTVVNRLIDTSSRALARPLAALATTAIREMGESMMDAVAKRPYLRLEKATFVDIEDVLVEDEPMWDSLQEFLGDPNVAPPVPDEQLSLMGDDSDIRASRNRPRNGRDIRGWGVANQYVLVDEDHNGYCPFCGDKLEGGF